MQNINIDTKIDDLNQKANDLDVQVKRLKQQAKLAAAVKGNFAGAVFGIQPNGNPGYVDSSINAQTHGVHKKHCFNSSDKTFGIYYEYIFKYGKENLTITSGIVEILYPQNVCNLLDQIKSVVKKKIPVVLEKEVEVFPAIELRWKSIDKPANIAIISKQ